MSEDNKTDKSHGKWHGGKGSARKDKDNSKFADGWDAIWGKKEKDSSPAGSSTILEKSASLRASGPNGISCL